MAGPHARSGGDRSPSDGAGGAWRAFAHLTVPGFAWEFLRRNPEYRSEFGSRGARIDQRWGLRFPADPKLSADDADVFWRAEVAPGIVLPVIGDGRQAAKRLHDKQIAGGPRPAEDGVHLRLSVGLQLLVQTATAAPGAVLVMLSFDQDFGVRVRAVEALDRAVKGRAAPKSRLTIAQRTRLARSLVALDGADRHESYRDIARSVFGDERVDRETWRTASIRDATIRLVRSGRNLMRGGYLKLLRDGL